MDVAPLLAFGFVTFLHYLSLRIEKERQWYARHFGRWGFWVHFFITLILWVGTYIAFALRNTRDISLFPFISWIEPFGILVTLVGIGLAIWSITLLGIKRMWGIRYFIKDGTPKKVERRGPYAFLKNPMYDGFFLIFLGSALVYNSLFYLIAAIESYLLLNVLLARFENKEL